MFENNCIVQNDYGVIGRVINYDKYSHVIHVIVRVNTFTWKFEKWHRFNCNEIETFLWPIETPFCIRYQKKFHNPWDMEID